MRQRWGKRLFTSIGKYVEMKKDEHLTFCRGFDGILFFENYEKGLCRARSMAPYKHVIHYDPHSGFQKNSLFFFSFFVFCFLLFVLFSFSFLFIALFCFVVVVVVVFGGWGGYRHSCVQCCLCLWIIHSWLLLRIILTFIKGNDVRQIRAIWYSYHNWGFL